MPSTPTASPGLILRGTPSGFPGPLPILRGTPAGFPGPLRRPAVFLDRDGTLVEEVPYLA
jgi:hypothetical protein